MRKLATYLLCSFIFAVLRTTFASASSLDDDELQTALNEVNRQRVAADLKPREMAWSQ